MSKINSDMAPREEKNFNQN